MVDTSDQLAAQAAHRALWVAALRSGKYKQGRNSLRKDDEYCCLGVACEVAMQHSVELNVRQGREDYYYNSHNACLPNEVKHWLGMSDECGLLKRDTAVRGRVFRSLVGMNDAGVEFNIIADYIENGFVECQDLTTTQESNLVAPIQESSDSAP